MMEQTDPGIILRGKKKCNSDLVDRISILPDCILAVILSFLPTKEAVATALVSKRWIFLWRTVHNLDFCHELCSDSEEDLEFCQELCSEENDNKFIKFVNGVLHLHDAGLLNKFSLRWDCRHVTPHTNSWINTAVTKNVHKLSLSGAFSYDYNLPVSVFRCDSLQSLELTGMIVCDSDISDMLGVCLPRLENLELDEVRFKSADACEKLINGCPILKNLRLEITNADEWIAFKCRISSASLRRLEIHLEQKSSLKLNVASLEYLDLGGIICELIIEGSLSSLVEAHLSINHSFDDEDEEEGISYNSIVEAIHAFGCAKVLTLAYSTDSTDKAFERATISRSFEFKRLVKFVSSPTRSLQDIIRSSDNLEVLEIEEFIKHPSKWYTFTEVPRCFSNSLKKVKIYFDEYGEDDLEIIRLILEHGSRLEVVEICCYGKIKEECTDVVLLRKRVELTQKILDFPRKSPACRVRITER